jgi:hypothetical protein
MKDEQHKNYIFYFDKWRDYDLLSTILSNMGLLIYFLNYQFTIAREYTHIRDPIVHPDAMDDPINASKYENLSRVAVAILSLFAMVCLYLRHYYMATWKQKFFDHDHNVKIYYNYSDSMAGLSNDKYFPVHTSVFNSHFVIEMTMLMICPIPYFDMYIPHTAKADRVVYYFLSELMLAIMAFRLIFLVRTIFNFSIYTDYFNKKIT